MKKLYECKLNERDIGMKPGVIVKTERQYILNEDHDIYERISYKVNWKLVIMIFYLILILMFLLACGIVIFADYTSVTKDIIEIPVYHNPEHQETNITEDILSIEDRCSNEFLSNEEVYSMSQEKSQYIINLIYARHGYDFGNKIIGDMFNELEWYNNTQKKPVTYQDLNLYEQYNVDLIVKMQNEQKYR